MLLSLYQAGSQEPLGPRRESGLPYGFNLLHLFDAQRAELQRVGVILHLRACLKAGDGNGCLAARPELRKS
jgi:hypothetical protein